MTSIWWEVGTLIAGAVLAGLLLAVGHWFPWVQRLDRVKSYIYGVMSLWLGLVLWRGLNGDWITPAGFMLIAAVGGGVVIGAYWVDGLVERARMGGLTEHAVRGALSGTGQDRGGGD